MNEQLYIESATSLKARLTRVCAIIAALEIRALDTTDQANVDEYRIDDGQTVIKTIYRSHEAIYKAIEAFEKLKQRLLNQLNGRSMVLRNASYL